MYSMTGFGRAEHATESYHVKVEMNSVNRKQSEIVVQLPKPLVSLELAVRKFVLTKVQRGRVQVSVIVTPVGTTDAEGAKVDQVKLQALISAAREIEVLTGQPQVVDLPSILKAGDIISLNEPSYEIEAVELCLMPAVEAALDALLQMRANEGVHMKNDISSRIQFLEQQVQEIAEHAPSVVEHYRVNLRRRLTESGLEIDLDDERVLKEVGLFAERCDIAEEISRLGSHFSQFKEYLEAGEPVGRSLDFLCQEINREFNTIGSKAHDAKLAQHVVQCKTELEKAREQVQNVE